MIGGCGGDCGGDDGGCMTVVMMMVIDWKRGWLLVVGRWRGREDVV